MYAALVPNIFVWLLCIVSLVESKLVNPVKSFDVFVEAYSCRIQLLV